MVASPTVPPMETRPVAGVPGFPQSRPAQIPVRTDLPGGRAQVPPELVDAGAAPEPVAVVDAVHDETGLEHERVRNHRVVLGIGVFDYVEVPLHDPAGVGQKRPVRADRQAEFLQRVMVVSRDGDDLGVGDGDLRLEGRQFQVLLMFLRTEMPPGKGEDQRIAALELAQRADRVGVIGQGVVRKDAAGPPPGQFRS